MRILLLNCICLVLLQTTRTSQLFAQGELSNLELIIKYDGEFNPIILPNRIDSAYCGFTTTQNIVELSPAKELKDVVVWLEGKNLSAQAVDDKIDASLKISHCQLEPRVLIISPRQNIRLRTEDPLSFDIHLEANLNRIRNWIIPPNLAEVLLSLEKAEIVSLRDELHPWIQSFVVVKQHPFFAKSDERGIARMSKIPRGHYELMLWHPGLGRNPRTRPIDLTNGNEVLEISWLHPKPDSAVTTRP